MSGLLLSGARYERGLTVHHDGKPVPSLPHIDMTVDMLRTVGVDVDDSEPNTWHVAPSPIGARDWVVEPDLSNATPFLAAAAVAGGTVTVPAWPSATTQPGDAIRTILARMGVTVQWDEAGLTVTGDGRLAGIDIDLHDVGELTPTVAALAALAEGTSRLRGITHLRGHETDRLAALVAEINGLGGAAEETEDGLIIRPRPLHGGPWRAYADHRMATAGAIIGLCVTGCRGGRHRHDTARHCPTSRMWARMLGLDAAPVGPGHEFARTGGGWTSRTSGYGPARAPDHAANGAPTTRKPRPRW